MRHCLWFVLVVVFGFLLLRAAWNTGEAASKHIKPGFKWSEEPAKPAQKRPSMNYDGTGNSPGL